MHFNPPVSNTTICTTSSSNSSPVNFTFSEDVDDKIITLVVKKVLFSDFILTSDSEPNQIPLSVVQNKTMLKCAVDFETYPSISFKTMKKLLNEEDSLKKYVSVKHGDRDASHYIHDSWLLNGVETEVNTNGYTKIYMITLMPNRNRLVKEFTINIFNVQQIIYAATKPKQRKSILQEVSQVTNAQKIMEILKSKTVDKSWVNKKLKTIKTPANSVSGTVFLTSTTSTTAREKEVISPPQSNSVDSSPGLTDSDTKSLLVTGEILKSLETRLDQFKVDTLKSLETLNQRIGNLEQKQSEITENFSRLLGQVMQIKSDVKTLELVQTSDKKRKRLENCSSSDDDAVV